jgi:peptidyl-tRNA hydrolase, PTH1 family
MDDQEKQKYLIIGLGNPGAAYEETRHNIGFRIVRAFGEKHRFVFQRRLHFEGEIAQSALSGKKVILLLPLTYMNSSGQAVRKCIDYFEIEPQHLLIVCDDIALPLGKLRLRVKGSAGGHNGLKSVEEHLGSQNYPRLRIGVGDRLYGELADHVLGRFTSEERVKLSPLIDKAAQILDMWISSGIDSAMRFTHIEEEEK